MMIYSPSRLARPSRAYLHVTEPCHLTSLADRVRQTTFHDVKGSWSSASGVGPPCVEFAPYGRTPGHGRRSDARQGTIDQDPEFISFLEDLTQPIPVQKLGEDDPTKGEAERKDGMKVTPLVQFLRDRKAAKVKNALATTTEARPERTSAADASKHGRTAGEPKPPTPAPRSIVPRRAHDAKASKDGGKLRSMEARDGHRKGKSASSMASKGVVTSTNARGRHTPSPGPSPGPPTGPAAASTKKRERGPASATASGAAAAAAAARILRRDLGLSGESGRARQDSVGTNAATRAGPESGGPTFSATTTTTTTTTPTVKGRGPVTASGSAAGRVGTSSPGRTPAPSTDDGASTNMPAGQAGPTTDPSSSPPGPTVRVPRASPAAIESAPRPTQAFLKHANPSQGITDTVLRAAMTRFGEVVHAEIDRKKGFAYVDFAAPEALQRAIQASPVTVAEGRVMVLERHDRPSTTGPPRGGGGGSSTGGMERGGRRGRGRGRGAASSPSSSSPRGTGIGGRRGRDPAGSAPPRASPS